MLYRLDVRLKDVLLNVNGTLTLRITQAQPNDDYTGMYIDLLNESLVDILSQLFVTILSILRT